MYLRVAQVCGGMVFCIGGVFFAGWVFDVPSLTTLHKAQLPVPFESALFMLIAGASLWLFGARTRSTRSILLVRGLLGFTAVFASLRCIENIFGTDLTFEWYLSALFEHLLGRPPQQMPAIAGLLLGLWSWTLLSITGVQHTLHRRSFAALIGFAVFVTSFIVLVGYMFGTPLLFGPSKILITLNGSIVFLLMSTGLIAFSGPDVFPSSFFTGRSVSAQLLRVFYPLISIATFFYGVAIAFLHDYPGLNIAFTSALLLLVVLTATSGVVAFAARRIGRSIEDAEEARVRAVQDLRESERRSTEALAKAHRTLRVLSESNQALIRATDLDEFLTDVCTCIVDHGGYMMVWIGCIDKEATGRRIYPVATAGPTAAYPELLEVCWPDTERGNGPTGVALHEHRMVIVDDITTDPLLLPWRTTTMRLGSRSMIALPLAHDGEVYGTLNIFCRDSNSFEAGEQDLLQELATDVAFGIRQLRARAELAHTRARMEEAFEEKRLLSDIIEKSSQPFSVAYTDGRIGYANQAFVDLVGYSRDELTRLDWSTVLTPPEWRDIQDRTLETIRDTGRSARFEKEYMRKDSTRVPVEVLVHLARDTQDAPIYYSCFSTDITERLRAENAIRESERRFRAIFETVQEVAIVLDTRGRLTFTNDYLTTISGWSREELAGRDFFQTFHPGDTERAEAYREHVATTSIDTHMENMLVMRDGSRRCISWANLLLRDEHGHVDGIACLGQDVTEREQMLEQLILAKERAERSDKLKDTFIANISHEIRTPLNVILGYTNVVEEHFAPHSDAFSLRFFEMIKAGSNRLMRTVDMMLNISRVEAGAYDTSAQPLRPADDLDRIARRFQPLAQGKGLVLRWINAAGDPVISVDWNTFDEAVTHLLDNAIKFTHTGSVTLRLYRDDSRALCLDVADTGIGIAPEYLPKIFTPYSQEEQGFTRSFEGIGLGLALVKRYLDLNDIALEVRSEKHAGTVFTLRLGACEICIPSPTPGKDAPTRSTSAMSSTSDRPRLLLVEDDHDSVEFMRDMLGGQYELDCVDNAADAWQCIEHTVISAILMDISIRGDINGVELTRQIRAHPVHSAIPIIAVSAHAFETDKTLCHEAGCDYYLTKPVDLIAMWNILSEVV